MSADGVSALERGTNQTPQRETFALLVRALDLDVDRKDALEAAAVRHSGPRRGIAEQRTNLPRALTRLLGRDDDMQAVKTLVRANALVTLTGAGGVGKTRLAVAAGTGLLREFADGVWFIDCAWSHDIADVTRAASEALGIAESGERAFVETIAHALQPKHLVAIFDNCEHVVNDVAEFVQRLIVECDSVRILATSRQPLGIPGERLYRVKSLDRATSIALFAERARSVAESFALSAENAEAVDLIVQQLDGIPLAIELAAARLGLLSPAQIAQRLSERFRVLTGGSRTALERQQTMRATIDWSYDLLDEREQSLFRHLSIFPATFTLDAANAVCKTHALEEWQIVDLLASLVDKSLLISEPAGSDHRYRLLESMRAYAAEKFDYDTERASGLSRFAQYFASLAERAERELVLSQSTAEWASKLEPEMENFRAAMDWAFGPDGDPTIGIKVLTGLQEFWILHGRAFEAARRAQEVLAANDDLSDSQRAALWLTLARMRHQFPAFVEELMAATERATELYERLGDRRGLATALHERGGASMRLGRVTECRADIQRSLEIFRELGDLRMSARVLGSLAYLLRLQGAFEEAKRDMIEVLQMARDIGDERTGTVMSMNIAEADFALGEVRSAVDRSRANLAEDEMLEKSADLRANQESNLAAYLFALGHDNEARAMALSAIRDAESAFAAVPLQHVAAIIAASDPKRAARLLGYVEKQLASAGPWRESTERYTYERLMEALHAALGDEEIAKLRDEGATFSEDQAMALAHRRSTGDT